MCSTLCNPMDPTLPGSSIYGIFQARILEWVVISFSRGSSQPWDQTPVSHTAGRLKCLQMSFLSFLISFSVKEIIRCVLDGCFHSHKPWVVACSSMWPNVSFYLGVNWSILNVGSVQFSCSVVSDSATPWITACQASLSTTNSQSLPIPMSTELVMPSNHPILCCPLLLLPSIFPNISVFSNESALCIMWPKYWSFSFKISPPNEHPGLICFRMDWLDLLAVQGTLKSLL